MIKKVLTQYFDRFLDILLKSIFGNFIGQKMRRISIRAALAYLQAVKTMRFVALGMFGLGVLAAVLIAGGVLMLIGLIGLLPLTPTGMAAVTLGIGLLLAAGAGVIALNIFSQIRWLEHSKSNEVIDYVLAPWETDPSQSSLNP